MLESLRDKPGSVMALLEQFGFKYDILGRIERVEGVGIIGRIGLTPSDLRQCLDVGEALADVDGVAVDEGLIGIEPGHERGAAGAAQRVLTEGSLEAHAAFGQAVDVRRFHQRVSVAAKVAVQVVADQEQDVRLVAVGSFAATDADEGGEQ